MPECFIPQTKIKGLVPYVAAAKLAVVAIVFALAAPAAANASSNTPLRDKDIKKAEKIISKLRRLEGVTASPADYGSYKAEMTRLYPGLFLEVSELGEGDLKTDLTTAVFLYDTAYRTWFDLSARRTDCGGEVRDIYLKLCRETRDGNPTRLLWSKARLHTKWGQAVVRSYRGVTDSETLAELSEIEAERKVDLTLVELAIASLRKLAGRVDSYSSGVAFEEAMRSKKISFEQLSREISDALMTVDQSLHSLPRGQLYALLQNARDSYRDGVFWWGKTYLQYERTVSVNSLAAPDPLKVSGLRASTVNDTVLANWRNALRYTREAERVVSALKS
jgi:hypothetical protein